MINVRYSPQAKKNPDFAEVSAKAGESNTAWLKRVQADDGILLLGGASLSHFRIRVAQSHLRGDLLPSFWSFAGLLYGGRTVDTVTLEQPDDAADVVRSNGVRSLEIRRFFDKPEHFPNVAFLRFQSDPKEVREAIDAVKRQRGIVDLPGLILPWLGFVWGAGGRGNPLLQGTGLPGAAFVEAVYALLRIDLTPGLSSEASCPEAIYQTGKWWRVYFEEGATKAKSDTPRNVPVGAYATRQPDAAAREFGNKRRSRRRGK